MEELVCLFGAEKSVLTNHDLRVKEVRKRRVFRLVGKGVVIDLHLLEVNWLEWAWEFFKVVLIKLNLINVDSVFARSAMNALLLRLPGD